MDAQVFLPHDTRRELQRERESQEEVLVDSARIAKFSNYMSLDDPRIAYASKEISKSMAQPTVESELKVKRVMRYLSGWPRCLIAYPGQDPPAQAADERRRGGMQLRLQKVILELEGYGRI